MKQRPFISNCVKTNCKKLIHASFGCAFFLSFSACSDQTSVKKITTEVNAVSTPNEEINYTYGNNAGEEGIASELFNRQGDKVGSVAFSQIPAGVLIVARLDGVEKGSYGFHIHETGQCDPQTGFKSAGGHLANGKEHGIKRTADHHPGDMTNIHVHASGAAVIEVLNTKVSLYPNASEPSLVPLLDADGSALMLHSGSDDYESQPGGAAGERMACAEINGPKTAIR